MHFIEPNNRNQLSLTNNMEDWVDKDNVVRLIDVMVDQIVKAQPTSFANRGQKELGRKAYRPETLQKLYLYGYLNGICSSRKLEKECHRNLEVMWLLGNLRPDHKTISDYRKDNREAIRQVCLSFRSFLKGQGFIEGNTVAYDGTKIKANASKEMVKRSGVNKQIKKLETELDKYLTQLQNNDIAEDLEEQLNTLSEEYNVETALLQKIVDLQKQLEKAKTHKEFLDSENLNSYAPADTDARLMKGRDGYQPAYNVQTGVDKKSKMIVMGEVTNSANDLDQLPTNVKKTKDQIGIVPKTVEADRGYAEVDGIQSIEKDNPGTQCIVPLQSTNQKKKDKKAGITFTFNTEENCFVCSEGRKLPLKARNAEKRGKKYDIYQGNCSGCPKKSACTVSSKGRIINRSHNKEWIDQYKKRLTKPEVKKKILERKTLVEHPYGTIKCMLGKIPLRLRGREKVQIEIDIVTTAYNLKRLLNLETMDNLLMRVKNYSWA